MSYVSDTQEKFRAVIVITKITPPTGKGVSYRIDTQNGNVLWLHPSKLGLVREGEEFEVEGTINANWHNITKVKHLGPAPPPTAPQPPTNGKTKMDYWKPRDPAEQKQIFVCALLARDIEVRGLMTEEELMERGLIHSRVWDHLFGGPPPTE